jgi:hypothetical protein
MSALSPTEQSMLRYWAMNMALVNYRWFPFEYDHSEQRRLAAIVGAVPSQAYAGVTVLTAVFYLVGFTVGGAIFLGPLLVIYPKGAPIPDVLFFTAMAGTIVFALSAGMPLAIGYGGRVVDWLLSVPAFKEREGDADLYSKVRFQFGFIAIIGVAALGMLLWVSATFDIDTAAYGGTVRWIYCAVLAAQAVLAFRFFRSRR